MTLGRFDGVDRWFDTPSGSGFDSRALQPQRLRCCEAVTNVILSERLGYQTDRHIETREASQ